MELDGIDKKILRELIANSRKPILEISRNIGIAFQLVDDLLDLEESKESLGKATNKDHSKNKKNLPLILGRLETINEVKKFHDETMESFSKLSLNNHPLIIYVENLFNRRN